MWRMAFSGRQLAPGPIEVGLSKGCFDCRCNFRDRPDRGPIETSATVRLPLATDPEELFVEKPACIVFHLLS